MSDETIIFRRVPPADMVLAVRAAKWMLERPERKDAILAYGEGRNVKDFYARRNKASITVRPC
jgi:hypothetical protein